MFETLKYETKDGAAIVTLNRPDRLNAFTYQMLEELTAALGRGEDDPDAVAIVLTGEGRGFSAGMDMDALSGISESKGEGGSGSREATTAKRPGDPAMGPDFEEGFTYMMSIRKPVIAAINGAAAGIGLSIALFCDMRFCAASAKFVTSFSQRGLVAEHGQSWILPRVVGPSRALDLFMSSRRVFAEEALAIGLVDRVSKDDELMSDVLSYVKHLAETAAPISLKVMKAQVYRHMNMSLGESLKETNELMAASLKRPDFAEGVKSFVEKRPPQFSKIKAS